jgi:agmatinase
LAVSDSKNADIGILGIPYDGAASFRKGAAQAPARIRAQTPHVAPFTERGVSLAGLRVYDAGDVRCGDGTVTACDWQELTQRTSAMLQEILPLPFLVTLGGDHSVTFPVVQEISRVTNGALGYLHIDAHLDLMNAFEGLRHSHACTARRVLELPNVAPEHAAFLGIRSWLDEEVAFLEAHPAIHVEAAATLANDGVAAVLERTLPFFHNVDAVYVSVDIDALDPAYAPGTGTPEAGGLSTRDLLHILESVFKQLPVRALDIVEVCPRLDPSDITTFAAIKLLYEALGWIHARHGGANGAGK